MKIKKPTKQLLLDQLENISADAALAHFNLQHSEADNKEQIALEKAESCALRLHHLKTVIQTAQNELNETLVN